MLLVLEVRQQLHCLYLGLANGGGGGSLQVCPCLNPLCDTHVVLCTACLLGHIYPGILLKESCLCGCFRGNCVKSLCEHQSLTAIRIGVVNTGTWSWG